MAEETIVEYYPKPMDTSQVKLSQELLDLTELLARNTHEVWARQRVAEGWHHGPARNEAKKEHPCLVPYEQLPENERDYDRNTALQTLMMIVALGFHIEKTDIEKTVIEKTVIEKTDIEKTETTDPTEKG